MTLFKINPSTDGVQVEYLLNSPIYYIDNFYENPDEVVEFIKNSDVPLHKKNERMSLNGEDFIDRRLITDHENMAEVTELLQQVAGQEPIFEKTSVRTNQTKFLSFENNPYENGVWFPHQDAGFTALIYLNKGTHAGTNLYTPQTIYPVDYLPEHAAPWKSRHLWPILKSITAEYNRLVMFDGKKFMHGMAINDTRFFEEERMNQVIFFRQ